MATEAQTQITERQKKWAAQHDWFRHETKTGCMCWEGWWDRATQTAGGQFREFTNFREMREWAGY